MEYAQVTIVIGIILNMFLLFKMYLQRQQEFEYQQNQYQTQPQQIKYTPPKQSKIISPPPPLEDLSPAKKKVKTQISTPYFERKANPKPVQLPTKKNQKLALKDSIQKKFKMEETLKEIEEKTNLDFSFSKPSDYSPPKSPSKTNLLLSPPAKIQQKLQVNQFSQQELPMIVIKKPENKPEIKNEIFFTHNDDSFSKPKEDEKETERQKQLEKQKELERQKEQEQKEQQQKEQQQREQQRQREQEQQRQQLEKQRELQRQEEQRKREQEERRLKEQREEKERQEKEEREKQERERQENEQNQQKEKEKEEQGQKPNLLFGGFNNPKNEISVGNESQNAQTGSIVFIIQSFKDNLFGNLFATQSNQQNQQSQQGSQLFGNLVQGGSTDQQKLTQTPAAAPLTSNLFGNGGNETKSNQSSGLFAGLTQPQTQPQQGGLFGNLTSSSGSGLFGNLQNTTNNQPSQGGLFGNQGSQSSSGGLFGNLLNVSED